MDNSIDKHSKGRANMPKGNAVNTSKLTEEQAREVKALLSRGARGTRIAKQFGVTKAAIYFIKTGKNWKHL